LADIQNDITRLVDEKLISQDQADAVDCDMLLRFFATPIGKRIRNSGQVLREFKFSLLDDASCYFEGASDERVLLQGVVDCAIIEDDGITVLDFKTDRATTDTVTAVSQKYFAQVDAYAKALQRIYQMPVKAAKLYFFSCNEFVDII
jgi:ATP-dependent helicase/nuclease subunit A